MASRILTKSVEMENSSVFTLHNPAMSGPLCCSTQAYDDLGVAVPHSVISTQGYADGHTHFPFTQRKDNGGLLSGSRATRGGFILTTGTIWGTRVTASSGASGSALSASVSTVVLTLTQRMGNRAKEIRPQPSTHFIQQPASTKLYAILHGPH